MAEEVNELGIENLKSGVKKIIDLSEDYQKAQEDGNLSLFEKIHLGSDIGGILIFGVTKGKAFVAEAKDTIESEREELIAYAQDEYDYGTEEAEAVVDAAIGVVLNLLLVFVARKK